MGKNGEKWGKMGKNGERILWGKHFTIGNFPIFPHWLPPSLSTEENAERLKEHTNDIPIFYFECYCGKVMMLNSEKDALLSS